MQRAIPVFPVSRLQWQGVKSLEGTPSKNREARHKSGRPGTIVGIHTAAVEAGGELSLSGPPLLLGREATNKLAWGKEPCSGFRTSIWVNVHYVEASDTTGRRKRTSYQSMEVVVYKDDESKSDGP